MYTTLSSFSEEESDVIYIRPVNVQCPSESCLTLSQFAQNTTLEHQSFIFLPGNHNLDTEIVVANISKVIFMIPNSSLVATIYCHNKAYLKFHEIKHLLIVGLNFIGCTNSQIISINQCTIQDSVFLSQQSIPRGSALDILLANAEIKNCSFMNNFGSYRGPMKILTDANVYAFIGGAVIANQSNVTIVESSFEGNSAEIGGAIFATLGTIVKIKNSTFRRNAVTCLTVCLGGILYFESGFSLTGSTMSRPRTSATISESEISNNVGLTMAAHNSSVTITLSFFSNNSDSFMTGGIVEALAGSDVMLISCEFSYHLLRFGSSIITLYGNFSSMIIHGSFFHNIVAIHGAVLFSQNHGDIFIDQCSFLNNHNQGGGVLVVQNNGNMTIINSEFANCTGNILVFELSIYVTINSSLFHHNAANHLGILFARKQCTIILNKCKFMNSTSYFGGAIVAELGTSVHITNARFANNTVAGHGGVVVLRNSSTANFVDSEFVNNAAKDSGGVVTTLNNCTITINGCKVWNNVAYQGGAIVAVIQNSVIIVNSEFSTNTADIGGAISIAWSSNVTISASLVHHNAKGVLAATANCLIVVNGSKFWNNSETVLSLNVQVSAILHTSKFWNNTGTQGGIVFMTYSNLTIYNSKFFNNVAVQGSVLKAMQKSSVIIAESEFNYNNAYGDGGALLLSYMNLAIITGSQFIGNKAANSGAAMFALHSILIIQDIKIKKNKGTGGALGAENCEISFYGICRLTNNTAQNGGAITAQRTKLNIYNQTAVMYNDAKFTGGGAYLYHSELICRPGGTLTFSENFASKRGGGIHAISSLVTLYTRMGDTVPSSLLFTKNVADMGGGLYLESNAEIHVTTDYIIEVIEGVEFELENTIIFNLRFVDNFADYGGGVYVADETNIGVCTGSGWIKGGCFLQVRYETASHNITSIQFTDNVANMGSSLYGGLLDRCGVISKRMYGVTYFEEVSGIHNLSTISSAPVRVCFCNSTGQPDCGQKRQFIKVMKGEFFTVPIVAVDQVNHTLMNVNIRNSLNYPESGFGEGQMLQTTDNDRCTDVKFSVRSPYPLENITMYAEGPCGNANISQVVVSIEFLNCSCPIGFQPKISEKTNCVCECDSKLPTYVTNCNAENGTILRDSNYWIASISNTDSQNGYLSYTHCPLDYCISPHSKLEINLSSNTGTNGQCANGRSGVLCGACQADLSLSIGSSKCVQCTKVWPAVCTLFLIGGVLAGIALVVLLMILNLTVAVGTLNGLLFFANVVGANSDIIFKSPVLKILSMPVSWLNLELGFDACFFKGMDRYWKTWIDLAFPTYIIILVIALIHVSEYSIRFSRLIARKNPVATLATLILLSYTKLLRAVITVFSFASLDYPDDSTKTVWLPSASVKYLSGRHIILFILAVIILIIGTAYTLLLFSWQWLLHHKDKKMFKWVSNQRLGHFFEPYHAPYSIKHRYWTGLLLFARVLLYLVFALNVSGDPGVNLLANVVVGSVLLLYKGICNQLYKNWSIDIIDTTTYFNIVLASGSAFFTLKSGKIEAVTTYISIVIFLVVCIYVLLYHMFAEVCVRLLDKMKDKRRNIDVDELVENLIEHPPNNDTPEPTYSEISGPPRTVDGQAESCANVNEQRDYNESATSRNLTNAAPILMESDI